MSLPDPPVTPRSPNRPPPEIAEYFTQAVPSGWFSELVVEADKDEILVTGTLLFSGDVSAADYRAQCQALIAEFRETSRADRVAMAEKAEQRFGRKVSWAAQCGIEHRLFTRLAVPAMTRLSFTERAVLDTLIAGGIARSRSEALAWCVQVVATKHNDWIQEMLTAVAAMERVRQAGPDT